MRKCVKALLLVSAAPHDLSAERAIVGTCLNTRHGIGNVREIVGPEDFFSLRLRELYAAALAMTDVVTLEERVAFAVDFCDATEEEVAELVHESPVMFDASPWARRVAAEARRRRAMLAMVNGYRELRDGAEIDDVLETVGAA